MGSTGSAGRGGPPPAGAEQDERFDRVRERDPLDSSPRAELGRCETYDLEVETAGWDQGEQPRLAASQVG
jgi:hypothetical protein